MVVPVCSPSTQRLGPKDRECKSVLGYTEILLLHKSRIGLIKQSESSQIFSILGKTCILC